MPKYCFDTSGISNPHSFNPMDIHRTMWAQITQFFADGNVAITEEIFGEMTKIDGGLGQFINTNKANLLHEINQGNWNWRAYLVHATRRG